jgi:hypothetical protein
MIRTAVVEALREVLRFLDERGIDSMLLGGLAIRVLAIPRPTFDVDLMVAIEDEESSDLAEAADRAGLLVGEEHRRGFVDRLQGLAKIGFSVPVGERLIPVDLFLAATEYQRAALSRRTRHETDLGPMWVASPEDVLLHKLLADRPRDRADVVDLLLVVAMIDMAYLRIWAPRLGVTDRLAAALRDAGRAV